MTYKIDKNIPIPIKGRGVYNKATQAREALSKMEIGDSISFPKEEYFSVMNGKKGLTGDRKFIIRKINDKEFRIFRTA